MKQPTTKCQLILGQDHIAWGSLQVLGLPTDRSAAAASVGGPYVRLWKGHHAVPNEDAAVLVEQDDRTLLAVFDAHCGHWSSHELASLLVKAAERAVPKDLASLRQLVASLALGSLPSDHPEPEDAMESESTLTIAVVDRTSGRLFGVAYGDSSVFVMPDQKPTRQCVEKAAGYINPWWDGWLPPDSEFDVRMAAGDLVLVCTDGVDECHYNHPETSIGLAHLDPLRDAAGGDVLHLARAIGELALRGVDGNPGGQDNVTLLVTAF